ncbi:PAN2-PAN3 deadenylation complex catalytic subunit PAN2 [Psilocybe cubensis]|uniref:PAN2-PAN3 deadenylation complex catalytic subunit PAN2 n=1 Tax=Psilocybe cubensis TaxID=181762 RepID=A0ACB8H968_PSICU|nr:PAN2-PAN3 deadenylation complex catalytic subunit PAN2 [Psilocybe cubensis]KAH9484202.1 PAN2-PAN3 deadenylation complex catalytic subunit PAN2 [Psilocybe cubensis]
MIQELEWEELMGPKTWLKHMQDPSKDWKLSATSFSQQAWVKGKQSRPFPDPLVKVYDVRTMRPLPPIPFSAGPAFIHALPNRTSTLVVVSLHGLIHVVDASNPAASIELYQLDFPSYATESSYITSGAISPSATYMAFGDNDGRIHIMSQADGEIPFNGYDGQPVPWANTPAPLPEIQWTKSTPLNVIGMPYFDTQLLSVWPSNLAHKASSYSPPPRIPPQILTSMKYNENIAYASLPKELRGRRNMTSAGPRKGVSRFHSGKNAMESEPEAEMFDHYDDEVPRIYRRVEIEYSKFGIEDFDFGFYNKTPYSGLETHILHSYTNSVIQVMHYIRPIRELAKGHTTINCPEEHCLLCEQGFISRMLEDAHGTNCQASNFCKTVGFLAQGSNAIELMDYGREGTDVDYAQKIQTFHRFLIDHMKSEANIQPQNISMYPYGIPSQYPSISPISQILGIAGQNVIMCSTCKGIRERIHAIHIVDMVYPKKVKTLSGRPTVSYSFTSILRSSLFRQITHKATCQLCKQFSSFVSRRSISSRQLPPILAINASVYNDDSLGFWQDYRNSTFLQPQISLRGQIGGIDDAEEAIYTLRALVVKITRKDRKSHLVAIVRVPEAESNDASSPWFLFNDFVVTNISQQEALSFQGQWKVPAILYFERQNVESMLDFSHLTQKLDPSILSRDTSISINRNRSLIKHEFLAPDELPKPGTLVAIDAEFVLMQQEETEFRSDGTKKVLRPARLSLARVSVLRGDGPRQGIPFIDDHIHTSETIVDYLTEFSGIKYGDLDPTLSKYTLTPLKLVYKKLRLLVDCGCIFIGHGLSKDFRIINIYVPPEQVLDTVDLYFIKARSRRLSLRFLSWYILGEHIQTDNHDSIEDARSALQLYKAYEEFEEQGIFDQKLEEIYREGRQYVGVSLF